MTETIEKRNDTIEIDNSFGARLVRNTISCYKTSGIIAVVIAVALGLCLVIGYSIIGIYNSVSVLPIWMQCAIVIALLPFVVALLKTVSETDCNVTAGSKRKSNVRFEVQIDPTNYDWSYIYLWAYTGWKSPVIIASATPKNNEAKRVANELLYNADNFYAKYIAKPSGTFTKVDTNQLIKFKVEITQLPPKECHLILSCYDEKGEYHCIKTGRCLAINAERIGQEWMNDSEKIYREYLNLPHKIITEKTIPSENTDIINYEQRINEQTETIKALKINISDLEKRTKTSNLPLPPLTNLERQTRKNNKNTDL